MAARLYWQHEIRSIHSATCKFFFQIHPIHIAGAGITRRLCIFPADANTNQHRAIQPIRRLQRCGADLSGVSNLCAGLSVHIDAHYC